jgi:hypothetical protein
MPRGWVLCCYCVLAATRGAILLYRRWLWKKGLIELETCMMLWYRPNNYEFSLKALNWESKNNNSQGIVPF